MGLTSMGFTVVERRNNQIRLGTEEGNSWPAVEWHPPASAPNGTLSAPNGTLVLGAKAKKGGEYKQIHGVSDSKTITSVTWIFRRRR